MNEYGESAEPSAKPGKQLAEYSYLFYNKVEKNQIKDDNS